MQQCQGVKLQIQSNRDLALGINQLQNALTFCQLENSKLKQCIAEFNQQQELEIHD